jgi:Flp pilus assembly protein TadB
VVLASRSVGSGTVFWSGLNLPYHIAVFKNAAESQLFARLIGASPRPVAASRSKSQVQAERVQAIGSGRGVLVRESISKDWHATLNGKAVATEMAGPGMMYIPLPKGTTATVLLTYHFSHVELAGIALSLLALVGLVLVLLPFRLPLGRRRERRRQLRERLDAALLEPDPMKRAAAINELSGQPLEPYAGVLLSLSLLELEPPVHEALVSVVKASKMTATSNADLSALRIWAWSQHGRQRS